jgi:hypothetical protein
MKATLALLAIAATVAATAAVAPALARTDPSGQTFITDTLGGNGHVGRTLLEPYSSQDSRIGAGEGTGGALNTIAPSTSHSQGYRFVTDTLAPGGGNTLTAASTGSFSWSDAGVGAATATGTILALIGALLLVTRRRSGIAAI